MAYTTPRTWVVAEIVTASLMNTHVRDNIAYLKGAAGTIAFEAGATFAAATTINGTGGTLLTLSGSATSPALAVTAPNIAAQNAEIIMSTSGQRRWDVYVDRAVNNGALRLSANTKANPALNLGPDGFVGVMNTTVPKGMIHGYDTLSGCIKWEADAVAGTLVNVIPNGAGDVVYGIVGMYAVRSSGGTTRGGNFAGAAATLVTPGNVQELYNVGPGTDVLQIQVAADGSVGVIRTAGTLTYKVSLWVHWL